MLKWKPKESRAERELVLTSKMRMASSLLDFSPLLEQSTVPSNASFQ